jgi:Holliday junction DNA helicase RuvA
MIGYLRGVALSCTPELTLLDVGGVGYAVHTPLSTYYEIDKAGSGAEVGLHVHTHLREGEISLFGFWTERDKLLFEQLIAVSGIGPRLARVILSGMAPEELLAALAAGDATRLTAIPGIGRKTAERMVVELRDRVQALAGDLPRTAVPSDQDVVSALLNLGYKQAAAERAVADARRESPQAEFHDLLRTSLKRLSRA